MKYLLSFALAFTISANVFAQPANKPLADSTQIKQTVLGFYKWYNNNYRQFLPFKLYSSIKTKEAPPYRINWKEVDRYFVFLRRSVPALGEEFIRRQRVFFKECDSAFKADTESEIPYGFDYDWYTNSQEDPQYLLAELKKAHRWNITQAGNEANVEIVGYRDNGEAKTEETTVLCLIMKKEKGKWTFAKIGCTFAVPTITED